MVTWTDEKLGTFEFTEFGWTRVFELPAFQVFEYGGLSPYASHTGRSSIELLIRRCEEEYSPTPTEVEIARITIQNHEALIQDAVRALYRDFLGVGPHSGMWWHGDIHTVRQQFKPWFNWTPKNTLMCPQDLHFALGLPSIEINEWPSLRPPTQAMIGFASKIDPEHGIGFLTDGRTILGIGYRDEVSPFR